MSNGGGFYRKPRASFSMKQIGNPVLVEFVDKTRAVLRFQGAHLKQGTSPDASNIEVYLLGKDDVETTITLDKIAAVYPQRPERKVKVQYDAQGNVIEKKRKTGKSVPLSELGEIDLGGYAIEDFDLDAPQTDEPTEAEIDDMIAAAQESDANEPEEPDMPYSPVTDDSHLLDNPDDVDLTYEPDPDAYQPEPEEETPAKKPAKSRKPKSQK